MIEIHLTMILMIAAAVIAVQAKDLLSSVIAVGAVGIMLCMAFLILKAPDLAVLQLVVELLSLILLIRATIRQDLPFSASGRWLFNTAATVLFVAVFIVAAYIAIKDMPRFGEPLMRVSKYYSDEVAARPDSLNVVAAISLKYRLIDTLGEMTILFTSLVGVLAVARRISRSRRSPS
jgi:multisubunit Na+/H+ antiporter MnhB subunit